MYWAVFTTLCSAFLSDRAVAIPYCYMVGKDALNGAAVEVHQNLRRQMDFLQSPQEEEMLVSLLDQGGGVEGPREVLGDVDTQKLEAGDMPHRHTVDTDGGVCGIIWLFVVHSKAGMKCFCNVD